MKKIFVLFTSSIVLLVFLFSNKTAGQENQLKKIDDLLQQAESFSKKYQDINSLKTAQKGYNLAEKNGDDKRKSKSSYYIALSLYNLGLSKESLSYIEKADFEKHFANDPIQKAYFIELKAHIYRSLNLNSQSKKEFENVFSLLKDNNSEEAVAFKSEIYTNFIESTSNLDSISIYFNLQKQELKKLPKKKYYSTFSEHYSYLGSFLLEKKNPDSAFYYFKKSYEIKQENNDPILYNDYYCLGDYYAYIKQYDKALEYYMKTYQNIRKYESNLQNLSSVYTAISSTYGQLGNKEKQKEFEELKKENNIKILKYQSNNVEQALKIILNDKEKEIKKSETTKYIWICIGVLFLILTFIVVYRILRKNLKHKEIIITEVHSTLQEKEEIISQKNVETEELQLKVNDAYNEVIELAKSNDPSFYFRFQEVYPDFQKKLLEHSPGLRTSELILCAYTFLGFNVKEVAEYTFKSVNTVRNRKQNLRKKFIIPTEQDMGIWLRDLIERKN